MANTDENERDISLEEFMRLVDRNDTFPCDSFPTFEGQSASLDQGPSATAEEANFLPQQNPPPPENPIFESGTAGHGIEEVDTSQNSTNMVQNSNEFVDSQPNEAETTRPRCFVIHPSEDYDSADDTSALQLTMPTKEEPKPPVVPKVVITQPSSSNLMSPDVADSESADSIPSPSHKTKCCSIL